MSENTVFRTQVSYLNNLEKELQDRKINYKMQNECLWVSPKYFYNSTSDLNALIPGTRNFMIKSFMGIKFEHDKILLVISSNRIIFHEMYLKKLMIFTNYLNSVQSLCNFFLNKGTPRGHSSKLTINAKRYVYVGAKQNISCEFIEEIISLDKLYQNTLMEHLPGFLIRQSLLEIPLLKSVEPARFTFAMPTKLSHYEMAKMAVEKAIEGMGFTQHKCSEIRTPFGKTCTITTAVNTDPQCSDSDIDWKVFPVMVEVLEVFISVRVKLCKSKHIVKVEDEKAQKIMVEFMNLANNDLKRACFRFNHTTLVPSMESYLVILGMDYSQIQGGFQEIFSYIISAFKKYGDTLSAIYSNSQKHEEQQKDAFMLYYNLRQKEVTESKEITQFMIKSDEVPEYLIIPKEYFIQDFVNGYDFDKEIRTVQYLTENLDECYHIKVCAHELQVKYPVFSGVSIREALSGPKKILSENAIIAISNFFEKLASHKVRVKNKSDVLSIAKVNKNYIVYFSSFPLFPIVEVNVDVSVAEQIADEIAITTEIFNSLTLNPEETMKISWISLDDIEIVDEEKLTGTLADFRIYLTKISSEEIKALESQKKINHLNIDSHIGFVKWKEQTCVVREILSKIVDQTLGVAQIDKYFCILVQTLIFFKAVGHEYSLINAENVCVNSEGTLKIVYCPQSSNDLWDFRGYTEEETAVFLMSILLFQLHTNSNVYHNYQNKVPEQQLRIDFINQTRQPIFEWKYEQENPKIVSFLRACWCRDIKTLEAMQQKYPYSDIFGRG